MTANTLASRFDDILQRLLDTTSASRTTLRLDDERLGLHVDDVAGEARRDGIKSLRGQTAMNQRELPTVQWLERERRDLVQPDLATSEVRAPAALIEIYGVQAQMLGPVVREGKLQGWVSVHNCGGTRPWSEADIESLHSAVAEVGAALDGTSR